MALSASDIVLQAATQFYSVGNNSNSPLVLSMHILGVILPFWTFFERESCSISAGLFIFDKIFWSSLKTYTIFKFCCLLITHHVASLCHWLHRTMKLDEMPCGNRISAVNEMTVPTRVRPWVEG